MSPHSGFLDVEEPIGDVQDLVDLQRRTGERGLEEFEKESFRRDRLFDLAEPGLAELADFFRKSLGGGFRDTTLGRAAEANVARNTANLSRRIRDIAARRGIVGQPLETSSLIQAEIQGGSDLNRLAGDVIGPATQFLGSTLPGATGLARPSQPTIQTGALSYLNSVLQNNAGLQQLIDKFSFLRGEAQGTEEAIGQQGSILDLFNRVNNN